MIRFFTISILSDDSQVLEVSDLKDIVYTKHEIKFKRASVDLNDLCIGSSHLYQSDGWLVPSSSCETPRNTCQTSDKCSGKRRK